MRFAFVLLCLPLGACLETNPGNADRTSGPIENGDATGTDTGAPTSATQPDSSTATSAPDTSAPDVPIACEAIGATCTSSAQCCNGSFCTFDPISYMQTGTCAAPLPEGSYCVEPSWCASGNCRDNTCGSEQCLGEGKDCQGNWSCCNDLFCSGGPYVYGECHRPRPLGEPCGGNEWCASGLCRDGACAAEGCTVIGEDCNGAGDCCSGFCAGSLMSYAEPACAWKLAVGEPCAEDNNCDSDICRDGECAADCQAESEGCWWDNDCCSGNFCEYVEGAGGVYSSVCTAQRGVGAECDWDHACVSGLCRSGVCQDEGCIGPDVQCYSNAECCTGACSWSPNSYAEGRCFSPMAAGAVCDADAWCTSGKCRDGFCQ